MRMKKMNQNDLMKDKKKFVVISGKTYDARVASAVTLNALQKYHFLDMIVMQNNGFESVPQDLWNYQYVAIIGVSPNDVGIRTIRSLVHDNNIVWIDNKRENIPLWSDYGMVPGDRVVGHSNTHLAWRFFHDMHTPPEMLRLFMDNYSVLDISRKL